MASRVITKTEIENLIVRNPFYFIDFLDSVSKGTLKDSVLGIVTFKYDGINWKGYVEEKAVIQKQSSIIIFVVIIILIYFYVKK